MPIRSTTIEFGRKLETVAQTKEVLTGADFGYQNFEGQINISADPEMVSPMANASRPLYSRKKTQTADVVFKEALVRGAVDGTAPSFYPILQAAGFTLGTGASADVATMGAVPDNSKSISCELYDGILKSSAWGVRGTIEISADKPGDRVLCSFNGKGHGDTTDQSAWPSGITDDTVQSALFESNTMTIGGFVPEVVKSSFKTEGDLVLIDNGLAADGFVEYILNKIQAWLRISVYLHPMGTKDWLAGLRDTASNSYAAEWAIDLGNALELAIAGTVGLAKWPNRADSNGVGILPLEFQFLRAAPITITQRPKV